jgi:hypothetical protein
VRATRESISARIFGTVDVNGRGGNRLGVEFTYDLPEGEAP